MEAKEYLEKSGLTELNVEGLDRIDVSRKLEKCLLDFLADLKDRADARWLAIAKTHIEEGGMAIRKAISLSEENKA